MKKLYYLYGIGFGFCIISLIYHYQGKIIDANSIMGVMGFAFLYLAFELNNLRK